MHARCYSASSNRMMWQHGMHGVGGGQMVRHTWPACDKMAGSPEKPFAASAARRYCMHEGCCRVCSSTSHELWVLQGCRWPGKPGGRAANWARIP